jgi:phospholipid/cholesterol/gamma-HCH transport system permease protein
MDPTFVITVIENNDSQADLNLALHGVWKTAHLEALLPQLDQINYIPQSRTPANLSITIDGQYLTAIDTGGALFLRKLLVKITTRALSKEDFNRDTIDFKNLPEDRVKLITLVFDTKLETSLSKPLDTPPYLQPVASLGCAIVDLKDTLQGTIDFLGLVINELIFLPFRISRFRWKEFIVQMDRCLIQAIPVVSLVTFLIGIVVAYLFVSQLEKYGANLMVVDSVALAMGRELAPLIVATVVAGRSGSAFTAQLGSMIMTEEVDALETMGLRPIDCLVMPRVIALMIALPLLIFVGDIVSLYGGSLIAHHLAYITPTTFLERLHTIKPKHFISGLIKAPFFALFIATIGSRMGLSVKKNAESVGLNTTATVVQCIVAVIIIDAIFAVFYMEIGY